MEMCRWLFQGFTEIQNGRHKSTLIFWGELELKKFVWSIFFKFQHHIPSNMWMCKWFFKDATKFQNGRQRSSLNFLWAQKLQNLKLEIIQILLSPRYGDVQLIFLRFYWNSKRPPWINFIFFCESKNRKIEMKWISNNSHCTITSPTIWKCACDFTEI